MLNLVKFVAAVWNMRTDISGDVKISASLCVCECVCESLFEGVGLMGCCLSNANIFPL